MKTRIALIALVVCILVVGLGWLVTPWIDGAPVLLSPAVRGVLRYAGQGEDWMDDLEKVEQLLLDALPSSGGNIALPNPEAARVAPGTLLNYTDRARRARELAMAVAKDADTTLPPEGLENLHGETLDLAQSYIGIAASVQEYLGVPTADDATRIGQILTNLSLRRSAMMQDYQALTLRQACPERSRRAQGRLLRQPAIIPFLSRPVRGWITIKSLDGRILDANPSICKMLGYTRSDECSRMATFGLQCLIGGLRCQGYPGHQTSAVSLNVSQDSNRSAWSFYC